MPRPVVIIGGGLSGLSAAYFLSEKQISCEIYEASERLGGRIYTLKNFYAGMAAELGAETIDRNHAAIITLVEKLGLSLVKMEHSADRDEIYRIGNASFGPKELYQQEGVAELVKRVSADRAELMKNAVWTDKAKQLDQVSIAGYLASITANGFLLPLLLNVYAAQFGQAPEKLSALNFITLFGLSKPKEEFRIFGESDECLRIKGGNSALIKALEKELKKRGVKIHTGKALQKMEGLKLSFADGSGAEAERIIISAPFNALRKIELPVTPKKRKLIDTLQYTHNGKLMVGLKKPLWEKIKGSNGTFLTDDARIPNIWGVSNEKGALVTVLHHGQKKEAILKGLSEWFGEDVSDAPTISHDWALGGYTAAAPGQYLKLAEVAEAELGGKLFFIGEHAAPPVLQQENGFMNGAVLSAMRVAERLI